MNRQLQPTAASASTMGLPRRGARGELSHTPTVRPARKGDLSVPALGAVALLFVAGISGYLVLWLSVRLSARAHGDSLSVAGARVHSDLVNLSLAQISGMGLALWMGLRWFTSDGPLRESLSLYAIRRRTVALCLLAGACLQFPLTEFANVLHDYALGPDSLDRQLTIQRLIEASSLGRGLLVMTCVVVAIPIIEELFFRGFMLFGLRTRYGDAAAILGSACLFGISHIDAVATLYATVAGLVLGWLALRTRSIWPGIAVHAAVNAMPVLLTEHTFPLRGFNVPSAVPLHLPVGLVLSTLVLSALCLAWAVKVEYGRHP